MEHLPKLRLVDEDGKPFSSRIDGVLAGLLYKFLKQFPSIRDEGDLTDVFEATARGIAKRERRSGPIEKVHSYAWTALRNSGVSWLRSAPSQFERRTAGGHEALATLQASYGSQEAIERDILTDELLSRLDPDEQKLYMLKRAGYPSKVIARMRGCTANAVNVQYARLKQKMQKAADPHE